MPADGAMAARSHAKFGTFRFKDSSTKSSQFHRPEEWVSWPGRCLEWVDAVL
jgi:hypothetical protein